MILINAMPVMLLALEVVRGVVFKHAIHATKTILKIKLHIQQ